ncbi:hypothetical protein PROFUN_09252 [Planoprotostelium fungivorum]|uniref:Uncharacterized protein n=1 Tax=Planoprotostelium fungivorum TaxID=1890364 RepID=A0A2P6NKV9_9EUKA|nr:hypothetical protein PROFUN_09252 [Planoprotostelium fungivorum]
MSSAAAKSVGPASNFIKSSVGPILAWVPTVTRFAPTAAAWGATLGGVAIWWYEPITIMKHVPVIKKKFEKK